MIRTACTIGFLAVLAAVGVLLYRHYRLPSPWEELQAEGAPPTDKTAREPARTAPIPVVETPPATPVRVAEPAPPPIPLPAITVGKRTHIVQPGESLWLISKRYYGTPAHIERIADANHMDAPKRLRPGQVLVLPEIAGVRMLEPDAPETPAIETSVRPSTPNEDVPQMPPTLSRSIRAGP